MRTLRWLLQGNEVALAVFLSWIALVYVFVPLAEGLHAFSFGSSAQVRG